MVSPQLRTLGYSLSYNVHPFYVFCRHYKTTDSSRQYSCQVFLCHMLDFVTLSTNFLTDSIKTMYP